jgi:hypothetical protein
MNNNPLLLVAGACILSGLLLVLWGILERGKAGTVRRIPLRAAKDAPAGELVAVAGVASSPVAMQEPLKNRPCVYFEELVETRSIRESGQDIPYWSTEGEMRTGGFYIDGPDGRAFVAPAGAKLIVRDCETSSESEERRTTVRLVKAGDTVCVLATAHDAGEFLEAAKASSGAGLPPELLQSLMSEGSGAAAPYPCFFADGGFFWVADRSYEDLVAESSGSATLLLSIGSVLAGMGMVVLAGAMLHII